MASESSHSTYYVPEQAKFPIFLTFGVLMMLAGFGSVLNHNAAGASTTLPAIISWAGFGVLVVVVFQWFKAVIQENHAGLNNAQVERSFKWGMGWFIFSEAMLFAAFFGALFYARQLSVPWLGGEGEKGLAGVYLWPEFQAAWPLLSNPDPSLYTAPQSGLNITSWSPGFLLSYLPFWNTTILVISSITLHFAHGALKAENRKRLIQWMVVTVVLGVTFLFLQGLEYVEAYEHYGITLDSGIYGSTFFILTGFHGFHVAIGTFILFVMTLRCLKGHFTPDNHFGFEETTWYWHFVDVVWLIVFVVVYAI